MQKKKNPEGYDKINEKVKTQQFLVERRKILRREQSILNRYRKTNTLPSDKRGRQTRCQAIREEDKQ
jgi:hypothetical protein